MDSGKSYRSRSPRRTSTHPDREKQINSDRRSRSRDRRDRRDRSRERSRERESRDKSKREDGSQETEKKPVKPNFELSGKLYAEKMTVNGVVLKYAEPADAAKPINKWRCYVFKDSTDPVDTLHLHRQSKFLIGRDKRVADIPMDHLSISSQHAVVQFRSRHIESELVDEVGQTIVVPYIIDLESTHGTFLNKKKIAPAKFDFYFASMILC